MEFYRQDQLILLYDTNEKFQEFYSNYFNDYVLTVKNYRTERNNIKWDHYEYKKNPKNFWVAVYKEDNKYVGITFALKVIDYGIFKVLPEEMLKRHWYIYGTYISPQYRNKGISKFMTNELIKKINPVGLLTIIEKSNTSSIKSRQNMEFKKLDIPPIYENTDWYLKRI